MFNYEAEYWNERKNKMTKDNDTFDNVFDLLDAIKDDFNAPRKNGYIPKMTVSEDDDGDITVVIVQELSQHMAKKLGL